MRSPMIGFPLARGAASVGVTKGAVARFLPRPPYVDGVNASSVTARVPYRPTQPRPEVDLGPLYATLRDLQIARCRSPRRRDVALALRRHPARGAQRSQRRGQITDLGGELRHPGVRGIR